MATCEKYVIYSDIAERNGNRNWKQLRFNNLESSIIEQDLKIRQQKLKNMLKK